MDYTQGSIDLKNASAEIRSGFVRKVYGITAAQLLLTAAIATPVMNNIKDMDPQTVQPLLMVSSFMTLATMCVLMCCRDTARTSPQNYILLFIFTACEAVTVGAICSTYQVESVVAALFATSFVVVGLTLYACTTKTDFTGCGPYLVAMLLALIGAQLVLFLVCRFGGSCPPEMQKLYAAAGVGIFSMYLVYDTQKIMGGRHAQQFGIDDYVFAAIQLYLDIINLFLYILQLLGRRD